MSAFSADNPGSNLPASPTRTSSPEDIFLTSKKFPGAGLGKEAAASESRPAGKSNAGRIAVTIAALVLVIGGIAWVVQYLPGKQLAQKSNDDSGRKIRTELLRFPEVKAVWDPKDEEYAFEVERDSRGSYDFYFENNHAGEVRLGLESTSCDCSDVKAALLATSELKSRWNDLESRRRQGDRGAVFSDKDLAWTVLDKINGMTVPENGKGLVRVGWYARKAEGTRLRLNVKVWANPHGLAAERVWTNLETSTIVVPRVLFDRGKISLGTLSHGTVTGRAVAFSATRGQMDLRAVNDDPLYSWKIVPLDNKSLKGLEAAMRKNGLNTRIRTASAVQLTIAEEKSGKILDQGPFQRRPVLTLDGESLQDGLPVFQGRVQGEIKIGGLDDSGKIQLNSFRAKEGVRQRLFLWTDRKVTLAIDKRDPPYLIVTVLEDSKEATEKERKWALEVVVPPGGPPGPLTEDSAILLRTDTAPPRRIRIPIQGTAVPG